MSDKAWRRGWAAMAAVAVGAALVGPGCSLTDQRYALRADACDIGAAEFGGLLPRLFLPLLKR